MSEKNRKTEIKEGGAYLGLPLCSPAAAGRPSQQAAQPTWPPSSVVFLPDRGTARADARAPPRLHLLLPSTSCFLRVALDGLHVATQPRPHRSHSPSPFPSSLLSPPHSHRTRPPPPTRTTTATGLPSPPRCAQELRLVVSYLLAEPHKPGCPEEPPSSSSPSSAARDRRRPSVVSDSSPSKLTSPSTSP